MNINPNAPVTRPAVDHLPSAQPVKVDPSQDGVFTIDDIICPFQRVAYNEGALKVAADGTVSNLPEVLRKYAGASLAMTAIANHAAKKLTAGSDWGALTSSTYNMQDLAHSSLDHLADTRILRGGFNQERLDKALSFSSDGQRLTLNDLRAFQQANLAEEPGKNGETFGGAEFALLVKTFGRVDAEGNKFMRNEDFVTIFKDNKWPKDWEPPARGSLNVLSTVGAVAHYFSDGNAPSVAGDGKPVKKGEGACPFIAGQPFDTAEAAKQHSEMLP